MRFGASWCLRSLKSIWLSSATLVLLTCIAPQSLHAQLVSGINGTVTDQSGAVVPGANVTVTNDATSVQTHAVTSSVGVYEIIDLIPGTYTVRVEKQGFEAAVVKGVIVEAGGKKSTADAVLAAGATTQTIEVTSSAISLETTTPDVGTEIEQEQIQQLPIEIGNVGGGVGPRGRQIDQFLFLAPGVTGGEFAHNIDGGVSYQNEVVFNGVVAVQSETQGFQSNINPPFELVNEIRVVSSNQSAQYGLAQGVASYQFASGTNTLHADAFEIMRNSYFDAPGAVNDQANDKPTPDKENNYGLSVGGPVWLGPLYDGRDKTFFHMSWERYPLHTTINNFTTIPTAAMVGGDFSDYTASNTSTAVIPIYVPTAWATNPSLEPAGCTPGAAPGQQFPGNKIPSDCFSSLSKSLLGFVPGTNFGTGPDVVNNFFSTLPNPTTQNSWGFSIDQNVFQNQKLHFSFWHDQYITYAFDHNGWFDNVLSAQKSEPRLGTGIFVTYSNVISSNLVMTAGIGWMGEINNELNTHLGYNFPGVAGSVILPAINFNGPLPNNPVSWGVNSNGETNSTNRKLGISFDNNWLWTKGRHTLNIGWEIRRSYQDDDECQECGGGFSFNSMTTSDGINFNTSGSSFASFLLGDADSATRQFAEENKLRNFYIAPYVQDSFKLSPKLTIDAGIRWDIQRPFTNNTNNVVFFNPLDSNPGAINPATGVPLLGAATEFGFCTYCSDFTRAVIHWKDLSPRLGFAYELNNKTVIRGGFAINFLDTGPYEYGNNKVAVNYGNLLTGTFQVLSAGSALPQYGEWDTRTMPQPGLEPLFPSNFNGTSVLHQFSHDPGPPSYIQMWNGGIQRELPGNMFLQIAYVGNKGIHLPGMLEPPNQTNPTYLTQFCPSGIGTDPTCLMSGASPNNPWTSAASQAALQSVGFAQASVTCGPHTANPGLSGNYFTPYVNFLCDWGTSKGLQQALLPYPMYGASESCGGLCNNFDMTGESKYNALQFQVQKRYSSGLSFMVAYTLSRAMSNTESGFSTFNFGTENKYNNKSEYSIESSQASGGNGDQTNLLTVTQVYELPIGPGKRFLHGSDSLWAKNLIGGWQVSGIEQYASGVPETVYVGGADGDPFGNGFARASDVPGQSTNLNYNNYYAELGGASTPVFNTAKFVDPGFREGNEPRALSSLRSPFQLNENIALAKNLFFGERVTAQLQMQFYNIFNRFRICNPDFTETDSTFGIVNGGSVCQANTQRQGQASFKLYF